MGVQAGRHKQQKFPESVTTGKCQGTQLQLGYQLRGAELLNMPHVKSNQSTSSIIRSSKSQAAESGTLNKEQGEYAAEIQSVCFETLKAEDVEVPSSRLKTSKTFLSQPSLAGVDMMQLSSPHASKPEPSRRSSHCLALICYLSLASHTYFLRARATCAINWRRAGDLFMS